MTGAEMLDRALTIAIDAHRGQVDKGGSPYILHPLSVMEKVETMEQKIVAILHDVLEDSDKYTSSDLRQMGFPDDILFALDCITKRSGEKYAEYCDRVKKSKIALIVKIADMRENSRIERIPNPTDKDIKRVERYKKKINELQEA